MACPRVMTGAHGGEEEIKKKQGGAGVGQRESKLERETKGVRESKRPSEREREQGDSEREGGGNKECASAGDVQAACTYVAIAATTTLPKSP